MPIFEEVVLTWHGQEYRLPPDKVLRAIARIEEELTMGQLSMAVLTGALPLAKLSCAYGGVLRMAGCRVTDEEVYDGLFKATEDGDPDGLRRRVVDAAHVLQVMMIPPARLRSKEPAKKEEAATEKTITPASSPPASASASAVAG